MLKYIELPALETPELIVVWLHGLGASGDDFAPMMQHLNHEIVRRTTFYLPHAPQIPVTINNGMVMPAWYNISSVDFANRVDEVSLKKMAQLVSEFLSFVLSLHPHLDSRRLILGGFSQGCAMSLYLGLCFQNPLAGIVGFSGYLPATPEVLIDRTEAQQVTPIFLAHGEYDPVIPLRMGQTTFDTLKNWGYQVSWHSYPIVHTVAMEQIADLEQWLLLRLSLTAGK